MEILVALFFAWLFVTLVGHGSWILVRAIFRALFSTSPPRPSPSQFTPRRNSAQQDIASTWRVIGRMFDAKVIDEKQAVELREHLDQLHRLQSPLQPQSLAPQKPQSLAPQKPASAPPSQISDRAVPDTDTPTSSPVELPVNPVFPVPPQRRNEAEEPILAPLVSDQEDAEKSLLPVEVRPDSRPDFVSSGAATAVTKPMPELATRSLLSTSELIQSFLAAHNIRWGELVAGMLIVICSIGLVISLWNPLVETHRVIPSLIFLAANAAIFSAGLYTLSRWRLRHTSRAVLVIATLLVPLSVLGGLAAAGTDVDAIQLDDPITLAAIAIAALVYGVLLLLGGKALTGPYARQVLLAVAGPVSILPLLPAAVRSFGPGAGWCIGLGSAAVLASLIWMIKLRRRPASRLGVVAGRSRLLVMSFGGFALAVSIGYAAFAVHGHGPQAWLAIAIATVPALVGLSAAGRSLMRFASRATTSMIGAIVCVLLVGIAWAILPVSMIESRWLWSWAIVLSVSGILVGWILQQPRWLPMSTLPVGVAAIVSSPLWLGGQGWDAIPFWDRLIGGTPMLATTLVATIVLIATTLTRDPIRRRFMGYATLFWVALAITSSGILAIGPQRLLGDVAPWWSVTVVLGACAIASTVLASRRTLWAYSTVVGTVLAWCSVYRPIELLHANVLETPDVWMFASLSVAATLMVLRELVPRLGVLCTRATCGSAKIWEQASAAACIIAATIACFFAVNDWSTSWQVLGAATVLLLWSATASRSVDILRVAQLASVAVAIVLGYGRFHDHLFATESWQTGTALWCWAMVAALITLVWLVVRELARIDSTVVHRRLGFVVRQQTSSHKMVDGITSLLATAMVVVGAAWTFAALLADAAQSDLITDGAGYAIPLSAIALATVSAVWIRRHQSGARLDFSSIFSTTIELSAIVWGSTFAAGLMGADPTLHLIIATTAAASICIALRLAALRMPGLVISKEVSLLPAHVASVLVLSASAVLLFHGWLEPLDNNLQPQRLSTIAVSAWWLLGAAGFWFAAKRYGRSDMANASALLAPAAVALLVPAFSVTEQFVWVQIAAITSLLWAAIAYRLLRDQERQSFQSALRGSLWWASAIGVGSAAFVTVNILFGAGPFYGVVGPVGAILATATILLWCCGRLPIADRSTSNDGPLIRPEWPLALTLLAGQATWLIETTDLATGLSLIGSRGVETLLSLWCVAAALSLWRCFRGHRAQDYWHGGLMSITLMLFGVTMGTSGTVWMPWIGIAAAICAGLMAACLGNNPTATKFHLIAGRSLGWATIVLGLLAIDRLGSGHPWPVNWTVVVSWMVAWMIGWRIMTADRVKKVKTTVFATPDTELSFLLLGAAGSELFFLVVSNGPHLPGLIDGLFVLRLAGYAIVACSVLLRSGRKLVWPLAIATFVVVASLGLVRISIAFAADQSQRTMLAIVTASFMLAMIAHSLLLIATLAKKISVLIGGAVSVSIGRLVQATLYVTMAIALASIAISSAMIFDGPTAWVTQLTIVSVALVAWTLAELAELSGAGRLRHTAVLMALVTVGLWASVDSGGVSHPLLHASMQWLVASVFTIPMALFFIPRLLGKTIASRWTAALQQAVMISATAAGCSLIVMLGLETVIRNSDGIANISRPLVIGVAVTLSILSALAGLIAILSGPNQTLRKTSVVLSGISDGQRRVLIIAAQAIGGLAWLHVFLCKTNWAFVGLRGYWPYIVMGLAFISVGATEWARRRSDRVLSETLRHSALYLPLIPVIGFWLSGSFSELSWAFTGGKVKYDWLLAVSAVYYIGLSASWKHVMPRIAAIVLGNAALWVVLVQQPNWAFLTHPQVWLIPPAVCVLVVAHLYRQRLGPSSVSAIRYASTLVIYVSSTADMLLQQIGTSVSGPIVLVLLALTGMLVGVVLRVRPFLYLGATFVFIGATSMVWHAQTALDAVWPWWVFGITTGIILLAGLTALEKNKGKLRRYADTLAAWQG